MTTTDHHFPAGYVVTARPWQRGTELAAQRGVVIAGSWDTAGEYVLVYFPDMGDPAVGTSVQPIMRAKLVPVSTIGAASAKFVSRIYNAMRRANRAGAWPHQWNAGGMAVEREHRARLAARARKDQAA